MNKYNPNIHHRRSMRLKGYDYSQDGLYYITICLKNRECLFGQITNDEMFLNDAGKMVENEWEKLPLRFKNIRLHEYIVMPNHFHAILEIVGATLVVAQSQPDTSSPLDNQDQTDFIYNIGQPQGGQPQGGQPQGGQPQGLPLRKQLGEIVGAFESITTVAYIRGVKKYNWPRFNGKLWQRNYWEHIIRDHNSYQTITEYIIENPLHWNEDSLNPLNE